MPRGPRADAPDTAHHVVIRGIERRAIFLDERDHDAFLERLDRLIPELGFTCWAWVLMPNHVHLALKRSESPLSLLMARLGTSYAGYFNRRHARAGHLFQNRFWSRVIADEEERVAVVRYIHRNPIRASLVSDEAELAALRWCGYGALVGERPPRAFHAVEAARMLDSRDSRDRDAAVHGSRDDTGAKQSDPQPRFDDPLPSDADADADVDASASREPLDRIIAEQCEALSCFPEDLATRTRAALLAKQAIAVRARDAGYRVIEVARALGVADSTVVRALQREAARPTRHRPRNADPSGRCGNTE